MCGLDVKALVLGILLSAKRSLFPMIMGLCIAAGLLGAAASGQAATGGSCESLKSLKIPETSIVSAQLMAAGEFTPTARGGGMGGGPPEAKGLPNAGQGSAGPSGKDLPPFCRVIGVVQPTINFEVWLPPASGDRQWNGKFNGVGNGGIAGFINYNAMMQLLARGYATASTDTGHIQRPGDDSWALGHPELVVDFASRGNSGWKRGRRLTRLSPHIPPAGMWIVPAPCVPILKSLNIKGPGVRTMRRISSALPKERASSSLLQKPAKIRTWLYCPQSRSRPPGTCFAPDMISGPGGNQPN